MNVATSASTAGIDVREAVTPLRSTVALARALLVLATLGAAAAGILAVDAHTAARAAASAGDDLTRLMRGMAAIKGVMALGLLAATWWRLGSPTGSIRFMSYAAVNGAMAAGVALIWGMAHLGAGALLLHAGLLAACLLLWRDPAVAARLAAMISARRMSIARAD